jgi:Tol biopolymer transport system component
VNRSRESGGNRNQHVTSPPGYAGRWFDVSPDEKSEGAILIRRSHTRWVLSAWAASLWLSAPWFSSAGAQTQAQREMSIAVVNLDGTGFAELVSRPGWLYGSPSYSHDMQRILLDGWPARMQREATSIFTANADGTGLTRVGSGAMPQWSPNQKMIAFHEHDIGAQLMSADGTGREVMLPEGGSPAWSPDGNRLAVLRWADDIQIIDLRTGVRRPLNEVDPVRPLPGFCWSPDGSRICFVGWSHSINNYERSLAIASTTHPTLALQTLETGSIDSRVAWSPDGSTIAFSLAAEATAPQQVYLVSPESDKKPSRLLGQPPARSNFDPAWSPDGKRLLFSSYRIVDEAIRVDIPETPLPSERER